jgi:hypothetical protein
MAGEPIKLGSAAGGGLVFEQGSQVTTSDSGIQSCSVKAIYGDGASVFSVLPRQGDMFNTVFSGSYLPSSFKVDYFGGGPDIEYLGGKAARVTINFSRPDPTRTGRANAKISVDSAINYKSLLGPFILGGPFFASATGELPEPIGFPEPVVTVKYTTTTAPNYSTGIGALYAQPGSTNAAGFPDLPAITVNFSVFTGAHGAITYWNGTTFVSESPPEDSLYNFQIVFAPNTLGWQLQKPKWDPHAAASFYDVEETWRGSYFFSELRFVGRTAR